VSEPQSLKALAEVLISPGEASGAPVPVRLVAEGDLATTLAHLDPLTRGLAEASAFKGKTGQALTVPGADGRTERVLFGVGEAAGPMTLRALPAKLAAGDYTLAESPLDPAQTALAFAIGSYRFDRYKTERGKPSPRLVVEDAGVLAEARRIAHAAALARDMVNTPASDMGPLQIETIAREIAEAFGAKITVIEGDILLQENYPAVHAVGRASAPHRAPRMIEIVWRGSTATDASPLIALVGKGVVFDTGGLDIKPSSGMRWMKKDMGGAAHALALARLVMGADLPVRLVVLTPVVENAISGDAMRPGDVLDSRAGLTIEVGNTDAEGRLILADALTRAGELEPTLTIDLATLTGAARVALGPEVIPFYTADDELAAAVAKAAVDHDDPLWRMPLWAGYEPSLDSDIADLKNDPDAWAQAGSVTAALFLKRFAPKSGAWMHLDIFAWNSRNRPGWPMGAEAQAIRALYAVLKARFSG
jgi:leucyl aminopeptidase